MMIRLENVLKMSWRRVNNNSLKWWYVLKTSWRCLEDIFPRRLEDGLKTSSRRLEDIFRTSSKHLQNVFKTSWRRIQIYSSWRRLEEVLWRRMTKVNAYVLIMKMPSEDKDVWRLQDVFKTYSSDVFMWCTIYKLKVLLLKKKHFHTKLPCQKPMLKQIKWKVQNERNKERSFATNYFVFQIFNKSLLQIPNIMNQLPKCPDAAVRRCS